jgi:outer membrane protein assembly factor BamB
LHARAVHSSCALVLAGALAGACGGPPPPPPAPLFPISTAWTAPLEEPVEGPLAASDAHVFVQTRDGSLHALRASDGRPAWRKGAEVGVIGAGVAVLSLRRPDGNVVGFDPRSGQETWRAATAIEGALPPVVTGDRVLVAGRGAAVLEAASGAVVWSAQDGEAATAAPRQIGPCVLIGEGQVLRCREAASGRSRWEYQARGTISSPVITDGDDRLLVGTAGREFLAIDLDDGDRQWRWKVGADVIWPALVWRDLVIFASHENVLYGLKRKGGNMVWRAGLPSRPLAPPILVGHDVLVACYGARPEENVLVGYDAETGDRIGELHTPGELASPPVALPGRLVLPLRDRRLVALALPVAPPAATPSPRVP